MGDVLFDLTERPLAYCKALKPSRQEEDGKGASTHLLITTGKYAGSEGVLS